MTSQGRSEYRFSGVNIAKRALEVNKPSSYGSNENQGLIIPVLPRPDFPQEPSAVAFGRPANAKPEYVDGSILLRRAAECSLLF